MVLPELFNLYYLQVYFYYFSIFSISPNDDDKEDSLLYSSVYSILPSTIDLIVGSDFKTEGFLKDYIESQKDLEIPEEFSSPIDLDTLISNDK